MHEFLRERSSEKFEEEPVVKPVKDVIQIFGDPHLPSKEGGFKDNYKKESEKVNEEGRVLTRLEIEVEKDKLNFLYNLPKFLLVENRPT